MWTWAVRPNIEHVSPRQKLVCGSCSWSMVRGTSQSDEETPPPARWQHLLVLNCISNDLMISCGSHKNTDPNNHARGHGKMTSLGSHNHKTTKVGLKKAHQKEYCAAMEKENVQCTSDSVVQKVALCYCHDCAMIGGCLALEQIFNMIPTITNTLALTLCTAWTWMSQSKTWFWLNITSGCFAKRDPRSPPSTYSILSTCGGTLMSRQYSTPLYCPYTLEG